MGTTTVHGCIYDGLGLEVLPKIFQIFVPNPKYVHFTAIYMPQGSKSLGLIIPCCSKSVKSWRIPGLAWSL